MILIEKNVPIRKKSGRPPMYPFGRMEIGDSFVAGDYTSNLYQSVIQCARRYRPKTFCSRKCMENGRDVLRVWRTA